MCLCLCLVVCLFACAFARLASWLVVCLFVRLVSCLFVRLFVCLRVCPADSWSVCLYVLNCLFVDLFVRVCVACYCLRCVSGFFGCFRFCVLGCSFGWLVDYLFVCVLVSLVACLVS